MIFFLATSQRERERQVVMRRPRFTPAERQRVWLRPRPASHPHPAIGGCWHCGRAIALDSDWHVDHHPVPLRDIEDQVCCGVTNPKDFDNLVPSCVACNVGHAYEASHCCGHGQLRCTCSMITTAAALFFAMTTLIATAAAVSCRL